MNTSRKGFQIDICKFVET